MLIGPLAGMSTPEHKVKAKLKRALDKLPCIYSFRPMQNGMGAPSLDVLICAGGWFIAIETKAPGKKPTPRQEQTIAKMRAAHGLVFVVDSDASMEEALYVIRQCCNLAHQIRS
jgi:hypothetical protein